MLFTGGVHATTGCGDAPSYDAMTMTETCPYDGNVNAMGVNIVAAANADVYDPQTDSVSAVGDMTTARSGQTLTLLPDGRVLLVGGGDLNHWGYGPGSGSPAELFDPVAGTFAAIDPGMPGVVDHSAGRLANGDVLVAGGRTAATHPAATTEAYTLSVGADGSVTAMPAPPLPSGVMESDPANTLIVTPDQRLVFVPGEPAGGTPVLYAFDPSASAWSAWSSSPPTATWPGAALAGDGTIIVCGGENAACGGTTTCNQLLPDTMEMMPFADLATLVRESPMVGLPSGGVVMTGGTSGETPTDCGGDAANNTLSVLLPQ